MIVVPPQTALVVLMPSIEYSVVLILLTAAQSLRTVFRLKNSCAAAGSAGALCAGKTLAVAAASLRAITEDTGRQLDQLKNIASE